MIEALKVRSEELQKIDDERAEAHPLRNGEVSHDYYSAFVL